MANKILDYSPDGLPIFYNEKEGTIQFKDTIVPYLTVKEAVESSKSRVKIADDLTMVAVGGFIEFGCLQLSRIKCLKLIKYISNGTNQDCPKDMGIRKES